MTTVLLTLGRLPKALDLARGFAAAGCRVLVADPYGHTLAGASRHVARAFTVPAPRDGKAAYCAALARIVRDQAVDWVVPVSEETMHVAFLRAMLPPATHLFTMPPDAVLALHDKASFARTAAEMGVAVPQTALLGSPEASAIAAAGDVVVKPVFSCSGRGLHFVDRGVRLPEADPAHPALVQRRVIGQEFSTCTIAHQGTVRATVVYRGTVMAGSVAVAFERVEHAAIGEWVRRFVAAIGWSGFIAFDMIVDDTGQPFAIECNPRANSGVHFWRAEDIARAVLDPAGGDPVRFRPQTRLQQFYACLTETQLAVFARRQPLRKLRTLLTSRDVTWDWRDPWPFCSMVWTSWPIIRESLKRGARFGEVATEDIDWFEDPA